LARLEEEIMVTPNQAVAKMVNDTVATIRCARDRYSEKLPESHERMYDAPSKPFPK
tara:strand:+ start:79 stop:246 length:168 start_codon:yes stop_codon:yes gene_type:complete